MADTKISALTAVTAPVAADEFAVNQAGTSKKVTLNQVWNSDRVQFERLTLAGTDRLTAAGTSSVLLSDFGTLPSLILGVPKIPSVPFTVPTGYILDIIPRLSLGLDMRATLAGSAELILSDDFATRSRIVLAGVG